jgi:GntR family transcriptional regulator, trigonelline degradation regulator
VSQANILNASADCDFAVPRLAAPLRQQAVERLRAAVISGRLAPGQRLVERELIELMQVSRTVVREALRQLEAEGLVAMVPHKGPVVRELTEKEARELYRIRAVLEALAARLFVENADATAEAALGRALVAVERAYDGGNAEAVLAAKNGFYEVLFAGAASDVLSTMLASVHARIWRWRAVGLAHADRSPQRSTEAVAGLRALVDAIKDRDADAAERLTREETNRAAMELLRLIAMPERAPA